MTTSTPYLPLSGLTVIELASVLAGPSVGMFLAELGARVIKIENARSGGDMTRRWKLPCEDPAAPVSAYFSAINYQKEYLMKDLGKESDRQEVLDLIKAADIVISNFKAGAGERFGLDGASLRSAHPRLIVAELKGFVSTPEKVAFDVVLQAETGYLAMSGTADGQAAKIPVALIDVLAAHQLKEGILLALLQRGIDGRGALVTTSLEEAALSSLSNQASNALMAGHEAGRMGTLHPNIAPYGEVVSSSDGVDFVLAIGTDKQFEALLDAVDADTLEQYRGKSNQERLAERDTLHATLRTVFSSRCAGEIEEMSMSRSIPIGRIRAVSEVVSSLVAQAMSRHEVIDGVETERLSSVAFRIER